MLQVHEDTRNASGLPHLSVNETMVIYDRTLLPNYLSQVSDKCALIETHKQWGKKCHVFWEWMVRIFSVLLILFVVFNASVCTEDLS